MVIARPLGQHQTVGPAIVIPAPAAAPVGFPIGLVALLCAGLIFLLAAGTIVIALIPTFLSSRGIVANCLSNAFVSTYNINGGSLPNGQLSPANLLVLQTAQNGFVNGRTGFNRCSVQSSTATVSPCPSNRLLLQKRRRRQQQQQTSSGRFVRQTNNNCLTQQIQVTNVLNCGCFFTGRALNRLAQRLAFLLRSATLIATFVEPIVITLILTGPDVSIGGFTTTAISTTSVSGGETSTTAAGGQTSTTTAGGVTTTTLSTTSSSSTSTTTTTTVSTTPAFG